MSKLDATLDDDLDRRWRAWRFAHLLLDVARLGTRREQVDLIEIRTVEICRAMGTGEQARLEDVRDFVYLVIGFLRGYGISISCGCGYLSLRVTTVERAEDLLQSARELCSYAPPDLEAYFRALVLEDELQASEAATTCDLDQVRSTLVKLG